MKVYRRDIASRILVIFVVSAFSILWVFLGDGSLIGTIAVLFFLCCMFFQLTDQVIVEEPGISTSTGIIPFLPRIKRSIRWSEVTEVRPWLNIAFVEADALLIVGHAATKKRPWVLIPIASLEKRQELLNDLATFLPKHTKLPPDVSRWAATVGFMPKWQLAIAMTVILVLATILWIQIWLEH